MSRPGAGGLVLLLTPEPDGEATGPYNGEYAGPQRHLEAADREVYPEEQAQRGSSLLCEAGVESLDHLDLAGVICVVQDDPHE